MASLRVLFVTSECAPWIKTGGLADVSGALPPALEALGVDVRVLIPGYPSVLEKSAHRRALQGLPATPHFPAVNLYEAPLPSGTPAIVVDSPALYVRPWGPYQDGSGKDWPDNAVRFARLAHVAAELASSRSPFSWRPNVVHAHDWQAGLAPAYMRFDPGTLAGSVATIHNLAFQGIFPPETVAAVGLPPQSFALDGLEYYGNMSFLKAALVYSDAITTVSPTYADEIQREPLGMGMQGLLAWRRDALSGILNGIDTTLWNPATDKLIAQRYDADRLSGKEWNKRALAERLGLPFDRDVPLLAMVSRLTDQKGIDLVLEVAPSAIELPAQLVVLGTGDAEHEAQLKDLAARYPERVRAIIGFDEALAHLVEAAADIFLMPSRFEPCGMNQMYSQRYGTVPVVHATGGLVDSVVDCTPATLADRTATGFLFAEPTAEAFLTAIERAVGTFRNPATWRALQRAGMARDFSWDASARKYAEIYERVAMGR